MDTNLYALWKPKTTLTAGFAQNRYVTYTIQPGQYALSELTLVVAAYSGDGQILGVKLCPVASASDQVEQPSLASYFRVFLVRNDTWAPVCPACRVGASYITGSGGVSPTAEPIDWIDISSWDEP